MKTATYPLCEKCNKAITGSTDGCIITGNLGVALLDEPNGIVGNNFPKKFVFGREEYEHAQGRPNVLDVKGETVFLQVKKSALHWWCLLKMAGADISEVVSHADLA